MGEGKKEKLPESLVAASLKEQVAEEKVTEQEPIKIEIEEIVEDPQESVPEHGEL